MEKCTSRLLLKIGLLSVLEYVSQIGIRKYDNWFLSIYNDQNKWLVININFTDITSSR